MKKTAFILTMLLALVGISDMEAQGLFSKKEFKGRKERQEYMAGAVPEADGKVTFSHTYRVTASDYTQGAALMALRQWADLRYMPLTQQGEWSDAGYYKNFEYSKVTQPDDTTIVCQADEELVFTNKTLARDATKVHYTLTLHIGKDRIDAVLSNIVYVYNLVETPERILAEDWITDKEAFNKKGELLHNVAKFRIKTCDLADQLFHEIGEVLHNFAN
ncbi:MAG: DUF4468 domain-containing protein [Prevotellaceae bacterium]|nr:DUF4468 domain-containing protein [Prevotellaceae bacterium]